MKATASFGKAIMPASMAPVLPPTLRADQEQMILRLRGLRGADFNEAYLIQQVQLYEKALQLQLGYIRVGDVPALKAAAENVVPIVRIYLRLAQEKSAM